MASTKKFRKANKLNYAKFSLQILLFLVGAVATTLSASEKEFKLTFKRNKPSENTEIIFYCMIGKRSGKAQQHALKLGYKK